MGRHRVTARWIVLAWPTGKILLAFFLGLLASDVEDAVVLAGFVEHLLGLVEALVVLDGVLDLAALIVQAVHDLL